MSAVSDFITAFKEYMGPELEECEEEFVYRAGSRLAGRRVALRVLGDNASGGVSLAFGIEPLEDEHCADGRSFMGSFNVAMDRVSGGNPDYAAYSPDTDTVALRKFISIEASPSAVESELLEFSYRVRRALSECSLEDVEVCDSEDKAPSAEMLDDIVRSIEATARDNIIFTTYTRQKSKEGELFDLVLYSLDFPFLPEETSLCLMKFEDMLVISLFSANFLLDAAREKGIGFRKAQAMLDEIIEMDRDRYKGVSTRLIDSKHYAVEVGFRGSEDTVDYVTILAEYARVLDRLEEDFTLTLMSN